MTKPINTLLQKEMSRKEFLATMGFGLATVMGFSGALKMLTGKSMTGSGLLNQSQSGGYGSNPYGGKKNGA